MTLWLRRGMKHARDLCWDINHSIDKSFLFMTLEGASYVVAVDIADLSKGKPHYQRLELPWCIFRDTI